jgi:hypothetical protein
MPGLDPGIHGLPLHCRQRVDGRVKPGHDGLKLGDGALRAFAS